MDPWKDIAKQNGIRGNTYWQRINTLGWNPEKAATTPANNRIKRTDGKWIKIAKKNGISRCTYLYRVDKAGWTPEEAATQLLRKRDDREWVKIAKKNGIPYSAYYFRVDERFWPPEEAATTPLMTIGEKVARSLEERAAIDEIRWDRINKDPNNLFKLTPQHLEIAQKNGINKYTVISRVNRDGWTVQDAIAIPPMHKKSDEYYEYLKIAKENNISNYVFRTRLNSGWSVQEAATIEVRDNSKRRRSDGEWVDTATKNGINMSTYRERIKRGWTPEEAAITPTLKNGEFLNEKTLENKTEGYKKFRKIT